MSVWKSNCWGNIWFWKVVGFALAANNNALMAWESTGKSMYGRSCNTRCFTRWLQTEFKCLSSTLKNFWVDIDNIIQAISMVYNEASKLAVKKCFDVKLLHCNYITTIFFRRYLTLLGTFGSVCIWYQSFVLMKQWVSYVNTTWKVSKEFVGNSVDISHLFVGHSWASLWQWHLYHLSDLFNTAISIFVSHFVWDIINWVKCWHTYCLMH